MRHTCGRSFPHSEKTHTQILLTEDRCGLAVERRSGPGPRLGKMCLVETWAIMPEVLVGSNDYLATSLQRKFGL